MKPKKAIEQLTPYQVNDVTVSVKLDANEAGQSFISGNINLLDLHLNRYPDNKAERLITSASQFYNVSPTSMIAGNGSSDMIELLFKTYVEQGDRVLTYEPSFSMYKVYSQIYGATFVSVQTNDDFTIDVDTFINQVKEVNPKLIFICTPNNPTGITVPRQFIETILRTTDALVVVDEAYIEFSEQESFVTSLKDYEHLVVLRTMSKAFGLAGLRLGYLFANPSIIETLYAVKSPYSLNHVTQTIGTLALQDLSFSKHHITTIKQERFNIIQHLKALGEQVMDSDTNFIFFKSQIKSLDQRLIEKGILIRAFTGALKDYYRVTVGTQAETTLFIDKMKEIINDEKNSD